jgi:hypothetical protein
VTTASSPRTRLRRGVALAMAALLAVAAYMVGLSGVGAGDGRATAEEVHLGPATVRVPAVTSRGNAVQATAGEIVRLEIAVDERTSWRSVAVDLPPWLASVGDVDLVSEDGVRRLYSDAEDLLEGRLSISASDPGHLRLDLEVEAPEEGWEGPDNGRITLTLDGDVVELAVARDDMEEDPVAAGNAIDPWPAEREGLRPWVDDEDERRDRAELNGWTSAPEGTPIDDWTRFVRIKDRSSPAQGRWLTDVHVYPGDWLDVALWFGNSAWPKAVADDIDDPRPETVDPAFAENLRLLLSVPEGVGELHRVAGRVVASNTEPAAIGHVATVSAERPVRLLAATGESFRVTGEDDLGSSWIATSASESAGSRGTRIGFEFDGLSSRYVYPGSKEGWAVPVMIRADVDERVTETGA